MGRSTENIRPLRQHVRVISRKAPAMTPSTLRGIYITAATLFSMIVGIGGGVLQAIAGEHPARAVIAGAATFGVTLTLTLVVLTFLLPPGSNHAR